MLIYAMRLEEMNNKYYGTVDFHIFQIPFVIVDVSSAPRSKR